MTTPPAETPKPLHEKFLTGTEAGDAKTQKEAVLNDATAKLNELKQAIKAPESVTKREVFHQKLEQFFYSFINILHQHNGKIPQEIANAMSEGMTNEQVAAMIDGLTKLADDDTDYELAKLRAEKEGTSPPVKQKRNAADFLYNMPDNPAVGMALDPILEKFGMDKKMIKSMWGGFMASILEGVPFAPGISFAGELRWKAAMDGLTAQDKLKILDKYPEQRVKAEWLKLYRKWLTEKKSDAMKPAPTPEEAIASLDKPAATPVAPEVPGDLTVEVRADQPPSATKGADGKWKISLPKPKEQVTAEFTALTNAIRQVPHLTDVQLIANPNTQLKWEGAKRTLLVDTNPLAHPQQWEALAQKDAKPNVSMVRINVSDTNASNQVESGKVLYRQAYGGAFIVKPDTLEKLVARWPDGSTDPRPADPTKWKLDGTGAWTKE